jgi:hypothetical protein
MTNIKQGDILTRKNGGTQKVLGICGEVYFMSEKNNYRRANGNVWTIIELEEVFDLPKEKWVPDFKMEYWFITDQGEKDCATWVDDHIDRARLVFGNCFKTEEEYEAKLAKIKAVFNE